MPKPENIIGKGFDKRPENINKKGRPRKLISHINKELKQEGFKEASLDEIKCAFLTIINLPLSKIVEIAKKENDEYPLLYKLTAKEMTGKRGMEMLDRLLDRAVGKAQQNVNHSGEIKDIHQIELIDVETTNPDAEPSEGIH